MLSDPPRDVAKAWLTSYLYRESICQNSRWTKRIYPLLKRSLYCFRCYVDDSDISEDLTLRESLCTQFVHLIIKFWESVDEIIARRDVLEGGRYEALRVDRNVALR